MNSIDFCFWLQGYFEISGNKAVSDDEVEIIKNHLNLVFKHEIDPLRESETPTLVDVLNEAHNGLKPSNKPNNGLSNDTLIRC